MIKYIVNTICLMLVITLCSCSRTENVESSSEESESESRVFSSSQLESPSTNVISEESVEEVTSKENTEDLSSISEKEDEIIAASSEEVKSESGQNGVLQEANPKEVLFQFVNADGNPVEGLSVCVLHMPNRNDSYLHSPSGKSSTGSDGIMLYDVSGHEKDAEETVVLVNNVYDSSKAKEYKIDMSTIESRYEFVWDIDVTSALDITAGIVIKIVDSNGNPVEGIILNTELIDKTYTGQVPGSGWQGQTSPSDANGLIVLLPDRESKHIFQTFDKSITIEVDYPGSGALVERTIILK